MINKSKSSVSKSDHNHHIYDRSITAHTFFAEQSTKYGTRPVASHRKMHIHTVEGQEPWIKPYYWFHLNLAGSDTIYFIRIKRIQKEPE
ncbi:uncharacterized protein MELLADRAFT_93324 [Melampsora larici-populina 98AG31]|uniref:Uncharacterized protein n=1 Tax=Melampsora larici-populina (strain 98AG31 / pathotype 3-4-7) TaxID=747676 RepID=F4S4S6_MELLP|nr:uncharacterized protein MELLADRAFT_93324 [Melampsora larici-populina 98AG31]EGG00340.1 hypothetical protein MELLADRAFT_93324 [Melampsora larici-populina 98AG31]